MVLLYIQYGYIFNISFLLEQHDIIEMMVVLSEMTQIISKLIVSLDIVKSYIHKENNHLELFAFYRQ